MSHKQVLIFSNLQVSRARFLQISIYYTSMFLLLDLAEVQALFSAAQIQEIKVVV